MIGKHLTVRAASTGGTLHTVLDIENEVTKHIDTGQENMHVFMGKSILLLVSIALHGQRFWNIRIQKRTLWYNCMQTCRLISCKEWTFFA